MENEDPAVNETETAFAVRVRRLVGETRGLLSILKSVKGLENSGKESQLYRITLKRFRDNCLTLAAFMEACSLLSGDSERDRLLKSVGCGWDDAKKRVLLG